MFSSKNPPTTPGKPPPQHRQDPNRPPPELPSSQQQQQSNDNDNFAEEDDISIHTHAENAELSLSALEVSDYWLGLNELRLAFELCDCKFSIQNCIFPAHRVVLSCCSRWLRSLLSNNKVDEEVITLDNLDPAAFEVVLGYLYGESLTFSPELSEEVVRVVRTFEMEDLEVRIWKYLIRSVTTNNCVWLHQLADAYECSALKFEAWRVIKAVLEDYENQPKYVLGDPLMEEPTEEETQDGEEMLFGNGEKNIDEGDDHGSSSSDDENGRNTISRQAAQSGVDRGGSSSRKGGGSRGSGGEGGDKPLRARDVVLNWVNKLQTTYEKCEPILTAENVQAIAMLKGRLPVSFYRERLEEFYEQHNPDKLDSIDELLEMWAGKEDELVLQITNKYKAAEEMARHEEMVSEVAHTLHHEGGGKYQ